MTAPLNAERDREQHLDEVLAVYLNAVQQGSAPPRQQLLDAHPDLASDLREFFQDQDCFDRLATPLRCVVPLTPAPLPWGERGWGEGERDFGDYTDLEEIARGGMGVVFRARQKSLNRRVALKMLLAGPLASADDVQRFRTEAEAAASLEHPHIVPIYEVGTHQGYPYLSMQLLEGGSLAHAAGRPPWRVEDAASARRVVRLLIDVAGAVHHAHQRGILHRDLKPANILLDHAGQAHVSDFGLAKRAPPLSEPRPLGSDGLSTLPNGRGSEILNRLTHTGAILGTPAYMAPEQASGERGAVTVAADVYGLGAILYELLTGAPPFRGLTPVETLRLVMEREPVAPSKLNVWVDHDLETICLKCLDKQPSRRYASADDLARDLKRYLRGEPIQARPVGTLERSWRWCKRQPAVAGLTLALLMTLTAAVSLLTVLWFRAERHANRAEDALQQANQSRIDLEVKRQEAEHAQADADASFRMAHEQIVAFSQRFVEELKQSPGLQPLQKAMLEATLAYLQKFVQQRGHDPALRRELADTYASIGDLNEAIGSLKQALEARTNALAIYRDLHERHPNDRELCRRFAAALTNLAILQQGREKAATMAEARQVLQQALQTAPDDDRLRASFASALHNLGVLCGNSGQPPEALDYYAQAGAMQLALLQKNPGDIVVQAALAATFSNTCVELSHLPGNARAALCASRHAQLLYEDLARRYPRELHYLGSVLTARNRAAHLLRDQGNIAESLLIVQDVLVQRKKLATENPSVTRFQMDVAESHVDLAELYWRGNRPDYEAARAEFEQNRAICFRLMTRDPDNPLYQYKLGVAWFDVSKCYGAQKKRPEELQALEKSRDALAPLVERDGDNLGYRHQLGVTLNNLGLVLARLNRYDDAVAALHQGATHSRVAYERAPQVAAYRETLNSNLGTLGEVERFYEHPERAVVATLERRKLWPNNGGELYRITCDLARAMPLAKSEAERTRYGDLTLETLRQAKVAGFPDGERLRQEKAFDSLRQRADFKQLLDDWVQEPRP